MKKYGYVYKITNNVNGKIYIGQKKGEKLVENYWGSGKLIVEAVKKYGKDNFSREILEWCETKDELNQREKYFIEKFNTRSLNVGYNLAVGGTVIGMKHSEETKAKISDAHKGKRLSEDTKRKLSVAHKGKHLSEEHRKAISETQKISMIGKNLGKHHSEETKKLMSEQRKGHITSEETRKKIGDANRGNVMSLEAREKMSASHKGKPAWNKGKPSPLRGIPLTNETKQKISQAMKGKSNFKGKHHTDSTKTIISEKQKENIGVILYQLTCRCCGEGFSDYVWSYKYCPKCRPRDYSNYLTLYLHVVRMDKGTGRNKDRLGKVFVDYKGNEVGVGSGFSDEQRDYYWEHPETILHKIIEVKYKEETKNKDSTESLQFPVFVRIRDDKEEISYE